MSDFIYNLRFIIGLLLGVSLLLLGPFGGFILSIALFSTVGFPIWAIVVISIVWFLVGISVIKTIAER